MAMGFVLAVRLYPMVSPAAVTEPFWAMVTRHLISGLVLAGIWLVLLIKSLYIITDPNRGIYEELNETWDNLLYFFAILFFCLLFTGIRGKWIIPGSLFCIFFPACLVLTRTVAGRVRNFIFLNKMLQPRVIFVGSRHIAKLLMKRRNKLSEGYYFDIVGMVDDETKGEGPFLDIKYLGKVEDLPAIVSKYRVDEVIIANPVLGRKELFSVLEYCEGGSIKVFVVSNAFDVIVSKQDLFELSGVSIIRANENSQAVMFMSVKRLFDIAVSSALLVVLAPIFPFIAYLIRRDSPGPGIFVQERVGPGGRVFRMYKFRTMGMSAEEDLKKLIDLDNMESPVFKLKNDPRITRLGRYLRKFNLDELPQLFNVLKGDMSLVGPRPEEKRFVEKYNIWERRRLKAKGGITGLQQVSCRGSVDLEERMFYDLLYVRKQSAILDLYILLRTLSCLTTGK